MESDPDQCIDAIAAKDNGASVTVGQAPPRVNDPLPVMTTRITILVFEDVEVLDFAGPYEVFTTASRVHSRSQPAEAQLFEVVCVSRDGQPVTGTRGPKNNA